ncbi:MAG: SDR family oxidoreductase [Bdellovibrionota bacterium]
MQREIFVTGGAGYVGSVLVPKLLALGHKVRIYDLMLYGEQGIPKHQNLKVIKGDIRDTPYFAKSIAGCDSIIHLACISNDPSFELNDGLSKAINYDCFEPMVVATKEAGVERFIYASTSSVYGVSDAPEVTEEHPLVPITDYNKYKGLTEPLLLKHKSDDFVCVVIRPATICGYSPRTRLDLSVNILTNHAVNKRKITVFGGPQKRPNIHIEDITDLYVSLLETPAAQIQGETFNAGFQNRTLADLAVIVKNVVEEEMPELAPIEIVTTESDDLRSYHVSSAKIARVLGFEPKYSIEDAVRGLCKAFKAGKLPNSFDDPHYFNVKMIKKIGLT